MYRYNKKRVQDFIADIDTPQKINMEPENTSLEEEHHLPKFPNHLVGGFNPVEKYLSNWIISAGRSGRGEHQKLFETTTQSSFSGSIRSSSGVYAKKKHPRLRKTFLLSRRSMK